MEPNKILYVRNISAVLYVKAPESLYKDLTIELKLLRLLMESCYIYTVSDKSTCGNPD